MEYITKNGRAISEVFSDSPVTRIRIKKNDLVFRYSKTISDERIDQLYDIIMHIEKSIPRTNPTVRIKVLDTDTLDELRLEIGDTGNQTVIVMKNGVDY